MSPTRASSASATVAGLSLRQLLIAMIAPGILAGAMWIATQGHVLPIAFGSFAASVQIVITALPIIVTLWLAALGLGGLIRHVLLPDFPRGGMLSLTIGMAALLMIFWCFAWVGWLGTHTTWYTCAIAALLAIHRITDPRLRDATLPEHWPSPPWTLLLSLPAVGLLLVACTIPPGRLWTVEALGYDVMLYHLQLPKEWLALGAMQGLEHNVYSYLPNFVEVGYMAIGAMHGGAYIDVPGLSAVYIAQLFHASFAVVAAITLANMLMLWTGKAAACFGGAVMLCVPWTLITGSMAYNEMAAVAFAVGGLYLALHPRARSPRGALLAGMLVGAATLCKLTAGPMLALPIAAAMLVRLPHDPQPDSPNPTTTSVDKATASATTAPADARTHADPQRFTHRLTLAAVVLAGVLLMLSPYLLRNSVWTGNPVFPFATQMLGHGHWEQAQVDRWHTAHQVDAPWHQRLELLGRQWFFNVGYGAVGGFTHDGREVARFAREWGLPLLWLSVLGAGVLAARSRSMRPIVVAMLIALGIQVVFWLGFTHHQARFMIPTILPACVLLGLGAGRLDAMVRLTMPRVMYYPLIGLCAALTIQSYTLYFTQLPSVFDPQRDQYHRAMPWHVIDTAVNMLTLHPINTHVPPDSKTYLLADNQGLFYLQRPVSYRTVWDREPLGDLFRAHGEDAQAITRALRERGYTHVWVGSSELWRLKNSYGFDDAITPQRLNHLTSKWLRMRLENVPLEIARLYVLPTPPASPPPQP